MFDRLRTRIISRRNYYLILIVCLLAIALLAFIEIFENPLILLAIIGAIFIIVTLFIYREKLLPYVVGAKILERNNAPLIYDKVDKLCTSMGILCPQVLVKTDQIIDVYSISVNSANDFIVFTSRALEAIGEQDLENVLKEELKHINAHRGFIKKVFQTTINEICLIRDFVIAAFMHIKNANFEDYEINDEFLIRSVKEEDIMSLFRIQHSAFIDCGISIRDLRTMMNKTSVTQVITKGGNIIGFNTGRIKLGLSGLYGRGDIIVIKDSYRGLGIGRHLTLNMGRIFKTAGCRQMLIEVKKDNTKAIKLYENIGFKKTGNLKDFYSKGLDAILMKWEL